MIRNPKKFYAILFSLGLLALLIITAVFRGINAPIERNIAEMQAEMTEAWSAAAEAREARMAEQLEHIKPTIEYRGNYFIEGMVIEGGDITHYCRCSYCCGKWANVNPQKTANGTRLDDIDRTGEKIASCNWLPFDSIVEVDGTQYRIDDRGGCKHCEGKLKSRTACDTGLCKVGRLDIYVPEGHQAALDAGRPQGVEITIIRLGGGEHNA